MKGSYFGFRSPQQLVEIHERSKNTFIVLYAFIFTLFAQQLPNDSLNHKMFQTPPLRDTNLWWLVWLVNLISIFTDGFTQQTRRAINVNRYKPMGKARHT